MDSYIYLIVFGACIIIAIISVVLFKYKKSKDVENKDVTIMSTDNYSNNPLALSNTNELMIDFDRIQELSTVEEAALIEIKDNKLIGRINNAVPELLKVSGQASSARKYAKAVKEAGTLYQAIIPTGAKLAQSKDMKGAVRGIYHGTKGIAGQANLKPFDKKTIRNLANANLTNAAMNAASMVVGQYYMSQINHQLDEISGDLKGIAAFQENEFRSKIFALIAEVQKYADFQLEIMESEEQRHRELDKLSLIEHECAQLLGQANLTISDFEGKSNDYSSYEKKIAEANTWYMYQQLLLKIMMEIDELTYVFSLGSASKEKCYSLLTAYSNQSEEALRSLEEWHNKNISAFEIDLDENRRKKQGWDHLIALVPSLFDNSIHYKKLPNGVVKTINQHRSAAILSLYQSDHDLFHQNVRLIMKDGKVFYLPGCEE